MSAANIPSESLNSYSAFINYCKKEPSFHQKNSNGLVCWAGPDWQTLAVIESVLIEVDSDISLRAKEVIPIQSFPNAKLKMDFQKKSSEILNVVHKIKGLEYHQFIYKPIIGIDGKQYDAAYLASDNTC